MPVSREIYTRRLKVSQLSGYVSEKDQLSSRRKQPNGHYRISLAQNFVGSNNMNLLEPVGQFGTRLLGGKDASSPRYIFTHLSNEFKKLFNEDDDNAVLDYLEEDGDSH